MPFKLIKYEDIKHELFERDPEFKEYWNALQNKIKIETEGMSPQDRLKWALKIMKEDS